MAAAMLYSGNTRLDALALANRGLNYGDGLFETMRVVAGEVPLWPRHLARLREGARRLEITLPEIGFLETQIAHCIAGETHGVLKLLLTRGEGGRGYLPAEHALPVWALSLHPLPPLATDGLRLHPCTLRLAHQPLLAGIKHCNRLEQVLARMEVARAGCDEGLLGDAQGLAVSATAANLLVLRAGHWATPPVTQCGVAGVLRGVLLERGWVNEATLTLQDVAQADAIALCNAVRGILSVSTLAARSWEPSPAVRALQTQLAEVYPMFSISQDAA